MVATLAHLVAVSEGLNVVVSGSITQEGSGYTVTVARLDKETGKAIVQEQRKASSKQDVLAAAGKLAERIRKGLGDTTPESAQRSAAETFTAASLEAAHAYAMGQDLQQSGKWDDAMAAYNLAVELDPELGPGYAALAAMDPKIGKTQDAEKNYQGAMARIHRMADPQ